MHRNCHVTAIQKRMKIHRLNRSILILNGKLKPLTFFRLVSASLRILSKFSRCALKPSIFVSWAFNFTWSASISFVIWKTIHIFAFVIHVLKIGIDAQCSPFVVLPLHQSMYHPNENVVFWTFQYLQITQQSLGWEQIQFVKLWAITFN